MNKENETSALSVDQSLASSSPFMFSGIPVGVFWDIENCPVPRGKSALAVAQHLRDKFFKGHREAEFMCVCDTSKEQKDVIEELNNAQVTVVHINATSKNAADDKLRQCLRRFAQAYSPPVTVILVSGDVNFASELSDLRHRHNFTIILVYKRQANEALLACAHESYSYEDLVSLVPCKSPVKFTEEASVDLLVTNLPLNRDYRQIRNRLQMLSDNCGGKVSSISKHSALIRFGTRNLAERAQKRMDGEDAYGYKIKVVFAKAESSFNVNSPSPLKQKAWRKARIFGSPCKVQRPQPIKPRISSPNHYPPMPNHVNHRSYGYYRPPYRPPKQHYNNVTTYNSSSYYSAYEGSYSFPAPRPAYPEQPYAEPVYGHPYYVPPYHIQEEDPNLKNVVDRFNKDQKTSREVLYLQQQLYQEDQEHHRHSPEQIVPDYEHPHPPGGGPIPPLTPNQKQHFWNGELDLDPGFRRTPGSKRPPSRGSNSNRSSPEMSSDSSSFQPLRNISPASNDSDTCSSSSYAQGDGQGVELMISNLDYNIRGREWKKILFTEFQQHVKVLGVYIHGQPDNTNIAYVKVQSTDDARYAISQFHRKKIGYKRIHVTIVNSETPQPTAESKQEVAALLKGAPDCTMPLFKCLELYEKQYGKGLTTAELYRMRDIVEVCDDTVMGRVVILVPGLQMPAGGMQHINEQETKEESNREGSVCRVHCREGSSTYLEYLERPAMPNIVIQLRSFATHVHSLLQSHDGGIPFNSFIACYTAEFGQIKIAPGNEGGVPLEYLITCVPGIEIVSLPARKIQWAKNKLPDLDVDSQGRSAATGQLNQFCKEVVELLRSQKHCRVLFSKFIPTYHQHFNRQCRVSDFGFSKLIDLLQAVPNVVQMTGLGSQRYVTLSHEAQVRRFASDIMRVLKSCASRQIDAIFIPNVYRSVIGREFDITDYGVCYIEDMLNEIPDSNIEVTGTGAEMVLSIKRRNQTPAEIERTKQFASEVVDLLKTHVSGKMLFKKFIPSYHHHFGRQCRVSDYGVTKLIELFELIPHVVEVVENDGEKLLRLTQHQQFKALGEQITALLQTYPDCTIPMPEFLSAFMKFHGCGLQLQDFNCSSVAQLIDKIPHIAKVLGEGDKALVKLTPLQQFAVDMCTLLCQKGGQLHLTQIEAVYSQFFGVSLVPAAYGYPGVVAMLEAIPHMIRIHGKGTGRIIVLNSEFRDRIDTSQIENGPRHIRPSLPSESGTDCQEEEENLLLAQAARQHNMDLLNQPVPSLVPSPELQPYDASDPNQDYMGFREPPVMDALCMTEDEKRTQWTPLCRTPVSEMLQFAAQLLPSELARTSPVEQNGTSEPGWLKGMLQAGLQMPQQRTTPPLYDKRSAPPEIVSGMVNGSTIKPAAHGSYSFSNMQEALKGVGPVTKTTHQQSSSDRTEKTDTGKPASAPALAACRNASQESLNTSSVSSSGTASPSKLGTPRRRRLAAKFSVPLDDQ